MTYTLNTNGQVVLIPAVTLYSAAKIRALRAEDRMTRIAS